MLQKKGKKIEKFSKTFFFVKNGLIYVAFVCLEPLPYFPECATIFPQSIDKFSQKY